MTQDAPMTAAPASDVAGARWPEVVGEAGDMPGSNGGFTMAVFKASDVPLGTALIRKSDYDRLSAEVERLGALRKRIGDHVLRAGFAFRVGAEDVGVKHVVDALIEDRAEIERLRGALETAAVWLTDLADMVETPNAKVSAKNRKWKGSVVREWARRCREARSHQGGRKDG